MIGSAVRVVTYAGLALVGFKAMTEIWPVELKASDTGLEAGGKTVADALRALAEIGQVPDNLKGAVSREIGARAVVGVVAGVIVAEALLGVAGGR